MSLLFSVMVVLLTFPFGKTFVLHSSPQTSAVQTDRCKGDLDIRKFLLESLNLQQEPRVSVSGMDHLRDQWKIAFKTTIQSTAGNSSSLEDSGNMTEPKCCTHSSQVFITDLGWEHWIVYPESFTFTQCKSCSHNTDPSAQCCKPSAHNIIPFVYMDERSSLVLSSVSLIRTCARDPGEDMQDPEVMTPS
ncbi:bone morphogenetic protein 6-like [Myxocyprinus asiaticus]|uniref:bone morphogenetic protein 6-like n=1 Tax=Myxocyprinus asiaticus TaxID=70543 RepID=UPI0022216B17|nr:bone morphogenetic protein 6-like [Myxocyprinus asiaticus]